METVYIPQPFALLFILPLVIGLYVFDKTVNFYFGFTVYLILQVSLAISARLIYG